MLGLAVLYDRYGTTPVATDLLYGVTPVVIAIVANALVLLGRTALKSAWLAGIGLAALGGYLAGLHPLLLLALGAALWLAVTGGRRFAARFGAPAVLAPAALVGPWLLPAPAAAPGSVSLATLFWTFLKLGSVVFGSGYVLLAFLRDDLVEGLRVLSDQQLVDAVAVGQVTPGPVFTTATFIGYLVAGTPGAVVATLGMFAPSFVLVPLIDRLLAAIRRRPWVRTALDGVNVVAVALMAGVAAQLGRTALVDPLTIALAAVTLGALLRWRPNPTWLIAAGAATGLLQRLGLSGRRPAVRTLTVLALTMAAMASHSAHCRVWSRMTRPTRAASTGLTLMKTPKNRAGTRRRASRSARKGTAEERMPAATAYPSALAVGGWRSRITMPIGRYSRADRPAAAADPSAPGSRRPTVRLSRM